MNWQYQSLVKLYFLHFLCAQNFKDKNHRRLLLCVFSTKIVNEFTSHEQKSGPKKVYANVEIFFFLLFYQFPTKMITKVLLKFPI